jgi:putative ABC transport system permease protein
MLDAVVRDVRFAVRNLAKAPTFTAAVVVTIALAAGATTAIFAVVDAVLLRPLPFPGAERASMFCETNPSVSGHCTASPLNVADWARSVRALEAAGVARTEPFVAVSGGETFGVNGAIASPGFFAVLGVRPALGRLIADGDLPPGANQVALLSHTFWERRFGGDRSLVGRSIMLDEKPVTVIGVLPPDAYLLGTLLGDVEVWKPLTASVDNVENRGWRGFLAVGRRAATASPEVLAAELDTVRARLAAAYPEDDRDWGLRIADLHDAVVGDVRPTLWIFLGAAAFVLLTACANVASLLLVRATGRSGEFAVRASLGAGRRQLTQQVLTESLLLSMAGGALGLLLASWVTSGFVAIAPASIPRLDEVTVDGRTAAFALALAAGAALLSGLAPARRAWRLDLNAMLKATRSAGTGDTRLRTTFVFAQLALALMLVVGAGLLVRSFARLAGWDPGFERAGVATAWMLPPGSVPDKVALMERIRDEVSTVPGVRSASLASAGPLFGGFETGRLRIEGQPPVAPGQEPSVHWFDIGLRYFETLGVRLVRGRTFTAGDVRGSTPVAVVNEAFARRFFAGADPIGRRITVEEHASEIVGVVGDMRPWRPDEAPPAQVYWPIQQYRRGAAYLVLRAAPGVAGVEKTVRARIADLNASVQVSPLVSLDERVAKNLVSPRFEMLLVAAFGLIALALAGIGVYGVMACGVAGRTREIGVRIALGAEPSSLVRSVVKQGMTLSGIGIAVGCAGALAIGRLLASLLYGL